MDRKDPTIARSYFDAVPQLVPGQLTSQVSHIHYFGMSVST